MCRYCCSAEPGFVFLSEEEISRMASYIGLSFEEFIDIYCRKVDYGLYYMVSLKEKENYDCIFLTGNGCSVYEVRPEQCRTYPFWRGIADSDSSWLEEAGKCPGIGKGRVYGKEEIRKILESTTHEPYIILKK